MKSYQNPTQDQDIPLDEVDLEADHTWVYLAAEQYAKNAPNTNRWEGQIGFDSRNTVLSDILFPGEQVLYMDRTRFWSSVTFRKILGTTWPLLTAICSFITGFCLYFVLHYDRVVFLVLLTLGVIFIIIEGWLWHNVHGDKINILTNVRAIHCFHKPNSLISSTSLPYLQLSSTVRVGSHEILFTSVHPLSRFKTIDAIRFENVQNPAEVERIVVQQKERNALLISSPSFSRNLSDIQISRESRFDERDMYYTSLKSFILLRSDHPGWSSTYQQLLRDSLEDDIEGKEFVLFSYSPPWYKLWKNILILEVLVAVPILLVLGYLATAVMNIWIFLSLSVITLFLTTFLALFLTGYLKSAFVITNRGVIILRTGLKRSSKVPVTAQNGFHYAIRLSYAAVYPMCSSVDLKTDRGQIQLLLDPQLTVITPDVRTVEEILYKSFLLAKQCGY